MCRAHRDEEAGRSLGAIKSSGEQFQPGVVPVHDQFPRALGLHLRQPCVLRRQARTLVPFVQVEHDVEEGRNRSGSYRLETGHRDGRRCGVRREGESGAIADQSGSVSGAPGGRDETRLRLCELEAAFFCVDKVTVPASDLVRLDLHDKPLSAHGPSQGIDHHEDEPVEWRFRRVAILGHGIVGG